MQEVKFGTIEEINLVKVEGAKSGVGTVAGAAIGGVTAGSNIGGGSGSVVAAIAGAVAGGFLGSMAEEKLTKKQGVEMTIKLEDGAFISVVQQVDPKAPFSVGERVKILSQSRSKYESATSRVVKLN